MPETTDPQVKVAKFKELQRENAELKDKLDHQQLLLQELTDKLKALTEEHGNVLLLLRREQAIVNMMITKSMPKGQS